jgi:peptidyl-tRNA hydrolase, PTH2 family
MYIFINKGLGMSTGKTAAQAGHAAVEAFRLSDPELIEQWYLGHHYAKYVMECRDRDHLLDTFRYLVERGFNAKLIIDEGHTEIPAITATAIGVEIVDKDDPHTAATFESFKLYRDLTPEYPEGMSPDYRLGFTAGARRLFRR